MADQSIVDAAVRVTEIALGGGLLAMARTFLHRRAELRAEDAATETVAVGNLQSALTALRGELDREREQLAGARLELASARGEATTLAGQVVRCRATVTKLRAELAEAREGGAQ